MSSKENADYLMVKAQEAGILGSEELANFMGQMEIESGRFIRMSENMNYSGARLLQVFHGRNGINTRADADAISAGGPEAVANAIYGGAWGWKRLGNTELGDGWKYHGRGYIQLTGRDNYKRVGEEIGVDLVTYPELAEDRSTAAKIAIHYWKSKVVARGHALDVREATYDINGGDTHLAERQAAAGQWKHKLDNGYRPEVVIEQRDYDPMRDLQQAITRITRVEPHDVRITNGMPDYLRIPAARPDVAMQDSVLRQGENGSAVRDLQEHLNRLGTTDAQGNVLLVDGDFGRKTRDAVENFQLWHGLPTTGVADRDTLAAMRNPAFVFRPARPGDAADLNTHEESRRPAASRTPADTNHPDHAMLERIRMGVRAIGDKESGDDDKIERISRSLLAACKDNREMHSGTSVSLAANALGRVDHVVMGTTGNIFAVEGRIDDPAHKRVCVPYAQAAQTPVEQSDQKLSLANQGIYQEQQLTEQQGRTRELDNPGRGGPAMAY